MKFDYNDIFVGNIHNEIILKIFFFLGRFKERKEA